MAEGNSSTVSDHDPPLLNSPDPQARETRKKHPDQREGLHFTDSGLWTSPPPRRPDSQIGTHTQYNGKCKKKYIL